VSGTTDALMYDSLMFLGREKEFKLHISVASLTWPAAASISSVVGGLLASWYGIRSTFIASFVPLMLALFVTALLYEPSLVPKTSGREAASQLVVGVYRLFVGSQTMLGLALFGIGVYACSETAHQFKGVFFTFHQVPLQDIGLWNAFAFGLSSLGSLLSSYATTTLGDHGTLQCCTVLTTSSLLFAVLLAEAGLTSTAAGVMCLGSISWGVQWPVLSAVTNSQTHSSQRATVISVVALLKRLGLSLVIPIFAQLADQNLNQAFKVAAGVNLINLLPLALIFRNIARTCINSNTCNS
jgi:hypothetical protein